MPAPTITSRPPRRSWLKPASMAAFLPEHSSTTSTARSEMRSGSHIGNSWRSSGCSTRSAPSWAASSARAGAGSTATTVMPRATSAAIVSAPIGPAPMTSARSPSTSPERVMPCSATANGSASAASRIERPSGRAHQRPLVEQDVAPRTHPGARRRRCRRGGSRTGTAGPRGSAGSGRTSVTARRPPGRRPSTPSTSGPDRGDRAGPLVAADVAGLAPSLDHHVEVGAAHPAVADRGEHLPGPGAGTDRASITTSPTAPVHRHRHLVGQRRWLVVMTRLRACRTPR